MTGYFEQVAARAGLPLGDKWPYVDWFHEVLPSGTAMPVIQGAMKSNQGFGRARDLRAWPHGSVVTAIIDDSIAFAHERFRLGGQTRIEAIWLQDAEVRHGDDRVPIGRELSSVEIGDRLAAHAEAGIIDEDALYRDPAIGLGDGRASGLLRQVAHGTLTLDLLSGYGPGEEEAANRPILAVQLPRAVTRDTSGTFIPLHTRMALHWIIERAKELGDRSGASARLPVVVSFSYGTYAGPHDGSSDLERALEDFAREEHLYLVMPAGNSYMSRTHARLDAVRAVKWRLQPDDRTPSFVEIWPLTSDAGRPEVEVTLTPPPGWSVERTEVERTETGPLHTSYVLHGHGGRACARVYRADPARGTPAIVAVAPTEEPIDPVSARNAPLAPCGDWEIAVAGEGPVDLWVQRDDTVIGPSGGRQSYFPEADDAYRYERDGGDGRPVDSAGPVTRTDTLNAMATGKSTVVVAGYRRSDRAMAPYSSAGRVGSDALPNQRPDVAVVCEEGWAHVGVLGAGSRSGSVVAMRGTSVAAPQVARDIARRLHAKGADPVGPLQIMAGAEEGKLPALPETDGDPVARRGIGRLTRTAPCRELRRGPRREADIEMDSFRP